MKTVLALMFIALSFSACSGENRKTRTVKVTPRQFAAPQTVPDSVPPYLQCIPVDLAKKIIGELDNDIKGTDMQNAGRPRHECTLTTKPDAKTGKTTNLYYVIEEFADSVAAGNAYDEMLENNRNPGQSTLMLGTKSLFHTDGKNFYMVMVLKARRIMGIKVNGITSLTSEKELKNAAATIASIM